MAKSSAVAFTGGKLNLKGDKKKPRGKKSRSSKHGGASSGGDEVAKKSSSASSMRRRGEERSNRDRASSSDESDDDGYHRSDNKGRKNRGNDGDDDDEDLTAAERRSLKFKHQRERKEMEQVVRCVRARVYDMLRIPVWHICVRYLRSSISFRSRVDFLFTSHPPFFSARTILFGVEPRLVSA
jgi:hypothetical protein